MVMLSVSGALLKAPRFQVYGLLVLISFVFFEHLFLKGLALHHGIHLAGFISEGLIMLSGLYNLFRFNELPRSRADEVSKQPKLLCV